jgi:hypothetical protein
MNSKVKGMTYSPDFQTTVKGGLPVGVVVESYIPYLPATRWAPPEGPEIEWFFIDSKGYRADWLLNQLTENEVDHVETELYEHGEEQRRMGDY